MWSYYKIFLIFLIIFLYSMWDTLYSCTYLSTIKGGFFKEKIAQISMFELVESGCITVSRFYFLLLVNFKMFNKLYFHTIKKLFKKLFSSSPLITVFYL